jgi:hypothetical protein
MFASTEHGISVFLVNYPFFFLCKKGGIWGALRKTEDTKGGCFCGKPAIYLNSGVSK